MERENERTAKMEEDKKVYDEKRRLERENERRDQMEEDKEAYDEKRRITDILGGGPIGNT